jgi:hypothetical protein
VFRHWSGAGEILMALPFYVCVFIAVSCLAFRPLRERDFQRTTQRKASERQDEVAS